MNPAILLIKSKQQKNSSMGTGFIIHQDNYGSYVLTCAHVVNQVVEPIINGIEVEEKDIVSSETIDLAVLYLKGLFQKPLKLQNRSCQGKDVQLMGYSGFTGDKYQGKLRDATILGDKITIEGTKDNTTYHAWQIIAKDNHEIERGNSGGPLVCQKSGKVIAVVSNHKGVHQGYAISIEHLQDIWDKMPPFLFESDDENESPFIGLSAFSIEQSHLFFGRDREINDIIEKLKKEDIIAVVGDSGSGKSSLIKAGVIPKYLNSVLDPEGNSNFHIINTRPARDPFIELSSSISDIGEEFNLDFQSINQMKKAIKQRDSESILNALEYILKQEKNAHLLIYIDQFEELFTLCSDDMQKEFIEVLLHLLNTQSSKLKIQIIFTMRKDYYNLISEYETFFKQTQKSKYILRRMSNEQIKECIEKPLEKTFINKEQISAFSKAVLHDMGDESSELALLQIALTQTWKHKKDFDNNLLRSYHEIGEVSGALSKLADDTWKILTPAEKQMLQYIFIRIVKPSDTGGIIRRLADRDEFSDEKWCLAQKLASALDSQGNIASDKNARLGRILTIKGQEGKVVELTHEALVRQWPMYQRWLKEVSKNNLKRIHDAVIDKNKIYQQHKKSKFLLMGYELEESLKLLDDEYKGYLSESEIAFIETSHKSTKMIRFWKRVGVAVLVALVVLSGYLVFEADRQKEKAKDNLEVANNRLYESILQEGITQRDHFKDPLKAKLLFAKAAQSPNSVQEKNAKILYENVMIQSSLSNIFIHDNRVIGTAFNKKEDRVLSWGGGENEGVVKLWSTDSQKPLLVLKHDSYVFGAAFNKNEDRILSWSFGEEGVVKLWSTDSQEPLLVLKHNNGVIGAAFNKNEDRILSWGGGENEGVVKLWSTDSQEPLLVLKHDSLVLGAVFNKNEDRILSWTGGRDKNQIFNEENEGEVKLWSTDSQEPLLILKHNGAVFNKNGDRILSWSRDGTVELRRTDSQEPLLVLKHDSYVFGAAFNKNEDRILSWAGERNEGVVKLWSTDSQEPLLVLKHDSYVFGAAFNKNEDRILSWGGKRNKGVVKLWSTESREPLVVLKHYWVSGAVFNKNKDRILSWSNREVKLWSTDSQEPLLVLKHNANIHGATFSKNGGRILSWSGGKNEGVVKLWSTESQKPLLVLKHDPFVKGAIFDKNEDRILSWGLMGVKLWSTNSQEPLLALKHIGCENGAIFDKSGDRILSWAFSEMKLWSTDSQEPMLVLKHDSHINGAAFSKNGDHILSWGGGEVKLWSTDSQEPLLVLKHDGAVFNKNGDRILSWSSNGTVELRRTDSQEPLLVLKHNNGVIGAAFNKNEDRILSWGGGENEGVVKLWSTDSQEPLLVLKHDSLVLGAVFNKNEDRILSRGGGEVKLWSTDGQEPLLVLKTDTVVFNKNGDRILIWSSDDGIVELRRTDSKEPLLVFKHNGYVEGVIFDKNGDRILSWDSSGGKVKLWSIDRQKLLLALKYDGNVKGAIFDKNGDRILLWDDYNTVKLYYLHRDRKLNKKFYSLEAEVESGLSLLSSGELKALSKEEWLKKKKEYQTVLNKQVQEESKPSLFQFVSDLFD